MVKQIFYQSSLPRAGSTLLQNIMGQNPNFYVTPTSGVLELIFAARGNYTNSLEFKAQDADLMKRGFLNFCKEGMYGYYNAITDKPYVIDKSRGWGIHYDFLNAVHGQEPKILCMVRDLRDIFTSMEKKFRANPDKDSGIVNWSKLEGTTTRKRVGVWSNTPPIGIAIERLLQMISEGIDKKVLFIKYEDLIENPKNVISGVYNYLGVDYYEHDFENVEQITQEDDTIYGIYGDHKIQNKLTPNKSEYDSILGKDLSLDIVNSYKWFYDFFNYDIYK